MAQVSMNDITESVKAKGENTTLLRFSQDGIFPVYAKEILASYLLMEWPLTGSDQETMRCYAALLPHGKVHALEIFFLRQQDRETLSGEYMGTAKVLSVSIPDNKYDENLDDTISEMAWLKVCGHVPN
jgi:hypothetical protein